MKQIFVYITFFLLQTQISYSQHSKKNSEKTQVKTVAIKALKWYFYKYGHDENYRIFKYIS